MVHLNLQDRALALPVFRGRIGPELAASQRRYRTAMKPPEEQVMNEEKDDRSRRQSKHGRDFWTGPYWSFCA
jgi:hypothetical protein